MWKIKIIIAPHIATSDPNGASFFVAIVFILMPVEWSLIETYVVIRKTYQSESGGGGRN